MVQYIDISTLATVLICAVLADIIVAHDEILSKRDLEVLLMPQRNIGHTLEKKSMRRCSYIFREVYNQKVMIH